MIIILKKQLILILLLFLFLQPIVSSVIKADQESLSNNKNESTPFTDYSRGFKIDFTPPDPVLDCGSFFFLNVTLTRCRLRLTIFSLSVFLNLKNDFEKDKIIRIGLIPFIYIPPLHNDPYTIQVPCFTTHQLASNLYCLKSKTNFKSTLHLLA